MIEYGQGLALSYFVPFRDHYLRDNTGGSECEGLSVGQAETARDGDFLDQVAAPDRYYLLVILYVHVVLG